ncbi:ATP-binding protein [Halorubrum laminariae]|uniref:histidine kinase n=1 Tax=Halorubrum laminariae TaxID=1433523 RepID=A0ABD6BZC8_9EURY|nr:ATP-binding protein [Halorubrum laminariae]
MATVRGHHAIVALGAAALLASVFHHGSELNSLSNLTGPLVALTVDGGIALAVIYAGRRIASADFSPTEEWRIARWTVAGTVLAVTAIGATLVVRGFEGRALAEPPFPLLVAAGAGSLGGAIAGYHAARQAAEARRARDAVRAVSIVNHLLRHDLRNDLTTISGYADLAAEGDARGDAVEVIARTAAEGVDRIEETSAVADALLGNTDLRRVDLTDAVRRVTAGFADRSAVTVETDLDDDAPIAATDGVRSIVDNLIENAVEHGGPEPTVRVTVRDGDETVTLTVDDDGPGLPAERHGPLVKVDEEAGGLWLVATLAAEYGGDVVADDADLGGARFVVTFPRFDPSEYAAVAGSDT